MNLTNPYYDQRVTKHGKTDAARRRQETIDALLGTGAPQKPVGLVDAMIMSEVRKALDIVTGELVLQVRVLSERVEELEETIADILEDMKA